MTFNRLFILIIPIFMESFSILPAFPFSLNISVDTHKNQIIVFNLPTANSGLN